MAKIQVKTKINGEETEFLCQPYDTVLDVLRRDLNMTGTKEVCSTGDCGACSITMDGRLVCSCLVLAAETEDKNIEMFIHKNKKIVGIMWHPERNIKISKLDKMIFKKILCN